MRKIILPLVIAALALSACATAQKLDAAGDVHALLIAIRDNDQQAFDARVDRPALKREIGARVTEKALKRDKTGLAALFAPSLVDIAGDSLIQPAVFKLVAQQYGYTPETRIPNQIMIAGVLKPLPDGRVCATRKKDGPCFLMFTKLDGHWKLSGFEGAMSDLKL